MAVGFGVSGGPQNGSEARVGPLEIPSEWFCTPSASETTFEPGNEAPLSSDSCMSTRDEPGMLQPPADSAPSSGQPRDTPEKRPTHSDPPGGFGCPDTQSAPSPSPIAHLPTSPSLVAVADGLGFPLRLKPFPSPTRAHMGAICFDTPSSTPATPTIFRDCLFGPSPCPSPTSYKALLSDAPLDVEAFSACLPALQRDAQVEFPDGNFVVAGPFVSSPQTPPPAAAVADAVDALISPPSAIIIAPWYDEGAGGWVVVQFMIAPAHCELHCPFQAAGTPGPDLLAAIHEANREIDLRLGRPVTEWVVARLFPPLHKDLKIASSGAIAYGILHTAVNKRGMHPEPPLDGWWRLKMLGDAALVRQRNGSPLHADRQGALDSVLATSPVSSDLQNATPVAPSRTDVSIPGALCPEAPSNAKASTIANPFSLIMSRKVKQSAVSTPHTTFSTAPASSKLPAPLKRPEMPALAAMVARNAATLAASIPPAQQTAPYDDLAAVEARLRAGVTRGVAAVGSLPSTGEKRAPPNVSRKRVRAGSDLGTPPPAKKRRAFLEPRGAAQQRALVLDAGAAWPCVSPVDLSGGQTDPGAQTANGRPNGGLTGLLNGVVAKMQLAEQKLLAKITKRGDDAGGKGGRVSEALPLSSIHIARLRQPLHHPPPRCPTLLTRTTLLLALLRPPLPPPSCSPPPSRHPPLLRRPLPRATLLCAARICTAHLRTRRPLARCPPPASPFSSHLIRVCVTHLHIAKSARIARRLPQGLTSARVGHLRHRVARHLHPTLLCVVPTHVAHHLFIPALPVLPRALRVAPAFTFPTFASPALASPALASPGFASPTFTSRASALPSPPSALVPPTSSPSSSASLVTASPSSAPTSSPAFSTPTSVPTSPAFTSPRCGLRARVAASWRRRVACAHVARVPHTHPPPLRPHVRVAHLPVSPACTRLCLCLSIVVDVVYRVTC
ncbi:uncharacterized protein BXZ73DRAFT_109014 [Epithele typhae]|uniref:uncharacterized protein n=1 Tax=Epithele typhae TaxID=378194 RepID=UPI002008E71A|nr:uncharacterized protein BXZ73DRAFT_109014 [Epithele typhae]KAH9910426.1 hypothetical protein BXZ73DRAFT_109014 [Epithele typhae]